MPKYPQKVTFILPSLASGGAERILITLMNNIDRNRFTPSFITLNHSGPLKSLIANDVAIHKIKTYNNIVLSFIPLLRELRSTKPDIIITTMAKMNFLLLLIHFFLPKETRIIIREAITPSFILETNKFGWAAKILYKILYPKADLVISPAQRIIDEFKNLLNANTIHHKLLYNAVNINLTRQHPLPETLNKEKRNQTIHFICAGRLHPQKGFDRLIEALPHFKCDYNWHLTILGDGAEKNNLNTLIKRHNLQHKVSLSGYQETPWPEIAASDCFLLPSRFEGLPNIVLESLSVGTTVIATKSSGGIHEIEAASKKGTVLIADTMPQFLDMMQKVKPNPTKNYRESLLPKKFETEEIVNRFMNMLEGNGEFSKNATNDKKSFTEK